MSLYLEDIKRTTKIAKKLKDSIQLDISGHIKALKGLIEAAAMEGKTTLVIDWHSYSREEGDLIYKHFKELGFHVCSADGASYIGWA